MVWNSRYCWVEDGQTVTVTLSSQYTAEISDNSIDVTTTVDDAALQPVKHIH